MPSKSQLPSICDVRVKIHARFGFRPCLWQVAAIRAILKGTDDVLLIAGTGMGKSLTFFAPLCFREPGALQIIVSPLNLLGKQQVESLRRAGFESIFICGDTATQENFQVSG